MNLGVNVFQWTKYDEEQVAVSSDPDMPAVFIPVMLLTQKSDTVSAPQGNMCLKDLYSKQLRQVQVLAETFWRHWRQLFSLIRSGHWTDRTYKQEMPYSWTTLKWRGMSGPYYRGNHSQPWWKNSERLMSRSSDRVPLRCIQDLFERWDCSSVKRLSDIIKYQPGSVLPPQLVFALDG